MRAEYSEPHFSEPSGYCVECGLPLFGEEHNHKKVGTLNPKAAHAYWVNKKEAEHASEPRQ